MLTKIGTEFQENPTITLLSKLCNSASLVSIKSYYRWYDKKQNCAVYILRNLNIDIIFLNYHKHNLYFKET